MDERTARRINQLIALAGSPNENEARNAAFKACQLMREAGMDAEQMLASQSVAALPGPPGRAQPSYQSAPDFTYPQLPDEGLVERNRILEAQANMRHAQAARAQYQLRLAEQQLEQLAEENERNRRAAEQRAFELRQIRLRAMQVKSPVQALPPGAGRRERY